MMDAFNAWFENHASLRDMLRLNSEIARALDERELLPDAILVSTRALADLAGELAQVPPGTPIVLDAAQTACVAAAEDVLVTNTSSADVYEHALVPASATATSREPQPAQVVWSLLLLLKRGPQVVGLEPMEAAIAVGFQTAVLREAGETFVALIDAQTPNVGETTLLALLVQPSESSRGVVVC